MAQEHAHGGNDAVARFALMPSFSAFERYRGCRVDLIPLKPRDKAPADKHWQARTYDQRETLERARRDGLNLGARLPDDVVVLDVDPRNFPVGIDSFAKLVSEFGLVLSQVPHVITGNLEHRGHHLYFRKPAGVKLYESLDGFDGLEFKSLGRQVVAAGSVHPTGGLYEWVPGSPPPHEMPDLPAKLFELLRRPARKQSVGAGELSAHLLAKCLEHLDPEDFREEGRWRELMMACHHATDGQGREEFIAWSIQDPEYADHEWVIGRRWDSLHSARDDAITIATLRKYLHDAGADIPPLDPEDDFDA